MPRRRSRRRKSKRRSKRRFGNRGATTTLWNRDPAPLGRTFKMTLPYSEPTISLDATTGLLADFVFIANGIDDPSDTGTGHQPLGYDQIKVMYDHWVVIGAVITVSFVNTSTDTMTVGILLKDNATAVVNDALVIENGSGKNVVLGPLGSSSDSKTITLRVNPNKFLGRPHPLSDPDLKGSAGTDPVEKCYFHVWGGSVLGTNPSQIQASTYIEYTAVFIEPVALGLS